MIANNKIWIRRGVKTSLYTHTSLCPHPEESKQRFLAAPTDCYAEYEWCNLPRAAHIPPHHCNDKFASMKQIVIVLSMYYSMPLALRVTKGKWTTLMKKMWWTNTFGTLANRQIVTYLTQIPSFWKYTFHYHDFDLKLVLSWCARCDRDAIHTHNCLSIKIQFYNCVDAYNLITHISVGDHGTNTRR